MAQLKKTCSSEVTIPAEISFHEAEIEYVGESSGATFSLWPFSNNNLLKRHMSPYTSPGVYIKEVSSGVHTISGVSTSIAAFFGRTSKGPVNSAVRVTGLADFERAFGDPHSKSDLADSVKLFFANGGTDCYVVRIGDATASSLPLNSYDGNEVLIVSAKTEGSWGDDIRLEIDYSGDNPDHTFNLNVYYIVGGVVMSSEKHSMLSMDPSHSKYVLTYVNNSSSLISLSLGAAGGDLGNTGQSHEGYSEGRRVFPQDNLSELSTQIIAGETKFMLSVNGSGLAEVDISGIRTDTFLHAAADITAKISSAFLIAGISESAGCSFVEKGDTDFNLMTIVATSGDMVSVSVEPASSGDISEFLMLGWRKGGVEFVRWSDYRPMPTATVTDISAADAMAILPQNAITEFVLDGTAVDFSGGLFSSSAKQWYEGTSGHEGVSERLEEIAAVINAAGLEYEAEVWGYHLAIISTSNSINAIPGTITTTDDATLVAALNDAVSLRQYALGAAGAVSDATGVGTAGTDGADPDRNAYTGSESAQTGFHALDNVDLFNLMILPADQGVDEALRASLWGPASSYCQSHRAFLLIDPPDDWTTQGTHKNLPAVAQDAATEAGDVRTGLVSDHAAVFYPNITFFDGTTTKTIGPSGAIAGVMARIDNDRGVWKASAGTEATLNMVNGLEVELTDAWNGILNENAVNCIRTFPQGIVSWGARTLEGFDSNSTDWKYIPIRRLALMIEESLYRGTRWAVFEPNDEPLWAMIRQSVGSFMGSLFRQGAFQGTTASEAYYVRCNKTTTTQNDRNLGIVNIEVGFAPLKPAEFVVIKIQQIAGEL